MFFSSLLPPISAPHPSRLSLPESWSKFSDDNILHSQSQRSASQRLREEMEALMSATSSEMWKQFSSANACFSNRISETTDAKNSLQSHLAKVRVTEGHMIIGKIGRWGTLVTFRVGPCCSTALPNSDLQGASASLNY